jgi:hypothetical protein
MLQKMFIRRRGTATYSGLLPPTPTHFVSLGTQPNIPIAEARLTQSEPSEAAAVRHEKLGKD